MEFDKMIEMNKSLLRRLVIDQSVIDQIHAASERIGSANRDFLSQIQPHFIEQSRLASLSLESAIKGINTSLMASFSEQAVAISQGLRRAISSIDFSGLADLATSLRELPEKTKRQLLLLGENGWYLDLDMSLPQLRRIERALESGEIEAVNDFLVEHYEENVDRIERTLLSAFPERATILRKAFVAHRVGDYELSIPVFLAQSDGISKEKTNRYIFIKKDGKPEAAQFVEALAAEDYSRALLSPLTEILPIMKSLGDRGPTFSELNRHMVLHGESVDYGTKLFGCKAISLINYVGRMFDE